MSGSNTTGVFVGLVYIGDNGNVSTVDQSVRWTGKNGKMIYAYGGDFNRFDASDVNFCNNGLVSPDRVPNPCLLYTSRCV